MGNRSFFVTPKERLISELDKAIDTYQGFAVTMEVKGIVGEEYVVSPPSMLPFKRYYYDELFNEELEMNHAPEIKIIRFTIVNFKPD